MSQQNVRQKRLSAPGSDRQGEETPTHSAPHHHQMFPSDHQQHTPNPTTAPGLDYHISQIPIFAENTEQDSPPTPAARAPADAPAAETQGSTAPGAESGAARQAHLSARHTPDQAVRNTPLPDQRVSAPAGRQPGPDGPQPARPPGSQSDAGAAQNAHATPAVGAPPTFAPLVDALTDVAPAQIRDALGGTRQVLDQRSAAYQAPAATQEQRPPTAPQPRARLAELPEVPPGQMLKPPAAEQRNPEALLHDVADAQQAQIAEQRGAVQALPRPKTPTVGKADPQQVGDHAAEAEAQLQSSRQMIETRVGDDLDSAVPMARIAETAPEWPEPQRVASETPAPPVAALPTELRDALETGRAADFLQRLPDETAPKLAPFFVDAADAQIRQHVAEETAAYRRDEQVYQDQIAGLRAETEGRIQEHQTKAQAEQTAVREQAHSAIRTGRRQLLESNHQHSQRLQTLSGAQQRQTEAQIQTVAQQREQSADTILTTAEREAEQRQTQAEQQAARVIADAQRRPSQGQPQLVQRQEQTPTAEAVAQQPSEEELAAARAEARRIMEEMQAQVQALLSESAGKSKAEIQAAIDAIQAQIAQFRAELGRYAEQIRTQMDLNATAILQEIDAALGAAETQLADIETRLATAQGADVAALEAEFRTAAASLSDSAGTLMSQIDTKAEILEPMYTYCQTTGACSGTNIGWIGVDSGFMSNLLGGDPGTIYFPYHTNAEQLYESYRSSAGSDWTRNALATRAAAADQFFPWEAMASIAYREESALHPLTANLNADEQAYGRQRWIADTMGILQTMIVRASPAPGDPWGPHLAALAGQEGYTYYDTDYRNPNSAALWDGQYANDYYASIDEAPGDQVRQEFYALAATMFFTKRTINQPSGYFRHEDRLSTIRGNDTVVFGQDTTLPDSAMVPDPRTEQPASTPAYSSDPALAGARQVSQLATSNGPGYLNVRSAPGSDAPAVDTASNRLIPGTQVTLTGAYSGAGQSTWVQISAPFEGWVHGGFLSPPVTK